MSPNTRAQLLDITRTIFNTYGDEPSDEALARNYECSPEAARAFWDEFFPELNKKFDTPGAVVPPARKAQPKKKSTKKKKVVQQVAQQAEKHLEKIHEPPVGVIRLLALAVSIILVIRPIGYAIDYFSRSNDVFVAGGMALGLAGAAFISPQVLILGFKNRTTMTMFVGTIMMVLSIWASIQVTTSELAYLRAKTQVSFVQQDSAAEESTIKRTAAQAALNTATQNLGASRLKFETLTKKIEFLMEGTPEHAIAKADLRQAEGVMEADKKVVTTKQDALDAIPVVVVSKGVAKEEGRRADLGFTTDLVFAITQDVVGPLMLSMAIFLRKRPGAKVWFWKEWKRKTQQH